MDALFSDDATLKENADSQTDHDGGASAFPLDRGGEQPVVQVAVGPNGADADGAEPLDASRALVLSDFVPPSAGAGERLIRLAYRMGIPGSALAAPFRKPAKTRLLATVDSPLIGDRAAGVALRAGHFLIHGAKAPIGQVEFESSSRMSPPFERVIHGFSWLRDLAASAAPARRTSPAAR